MCYTIIKEREVEAERLHGSEEPKNLPFPKKSLTNDNTYGIIIIEREVMNYDEQNISI
jgi:hypothetical protein